MFTLDTTYVPPSAATKVSDIYPNGVNIPLGLTVVGFAPPQAGDKVIAADALKKGTSTADSRVRTARENNSANSAPRLIVA